MKRRLGPWAMVILIITALSALASAQAASDDLTVGGDIPFSAITDLYYTYDSATNPPRYQRYRFYVEEGTPWFYHETREGDGWPLREEDITISGTVPLTEEQWQAFCLLIQGGTASVRRESLDDGDPGPWLYLYWTGGEAEGREFRFETYGKQNAFEVLCDNTTCMPCNNGHSPCGLNAAMGIKPSLPTSVSFGPGIQAALRNGDLNAQDMRDDINSMDDIPEELRNSMLRALDKALEPGEECWVGGTLYKGAKIGPNDPCPCGSGKKYKKCCGKRS